MIPNLSSLKIPKDFLEKHQEILGSFIKRIFQLYKQQSQPNSRVSIFLGTYNLFIAYLFRVTKNEEQSKLLQLQTESLQCYSEACLWLVLNLLSTPERYESDDHYYSYQQIITQTLDYELIYLPLSHGTLFPEQEVTPLIQKELISWMSDWKNYGQE